jgi:tellurite methyltransferase
MGHLKLLVLILCIALESFARTPVPASRFEHLTGLKVNLESKAAWDAKYNRPHFIFGKRPAQFLFDNYMFIPKESHVLDMGMGEGRNAVFLAQKGYEVTGVDISSVAIKKAQYLAKEYDVKIKSIVGRMQDFVSPQLYDAIICFYYVDRALINKMRSWLRPGGVLIFEAHTLRQRTKLMHAQDPIEYFLKEQELLKWFNGWKILKFEEPLHEKDYRSSIVLQKPE